MGTHAYELELPRFMKLMFGFYPMPIIYPLCCIFAKTSLIYFYTRLNPSRVYQATAWFGLFFIFGSNVGLAFATAFPCKPLELSWNPLVPGTCIDRPATYKATAIIGLLSDVYLILLPVPTVVGLQMPWQQKAGIVEANLMIVCATLPSLRAFFLHISPRLLGQGSSSSSSGSDRRAKDQSEDSELVTFGRSDQKKRKRAMRLPNTMYGLDTFNDVTVRAGNDDPKTFADTDACPLGDCVSQRGILRTKTASISYGGQ
ncbi:hypothetical protein PG985_016104 [Apiospora marii]|uniref:uncharacterized protein n=1 Tax=Apiospora marii TaxID=335849 RepID=UPI00312D2F76